MPAPGLPLQELWEIIIDHLHESPAELKSTSLTCRSFVSPAQSHIFREISVPVKHGDSGIKQRIQAKRLHALMNSSPHLIPYVHSLSLGTCEPEILIPLARIRWSRVHTLSLADMAQDPYDEFVHSIQMLIGLSSLRTLAIRDFERCNAEQLHTILSYCNAGLENITLTFCDIYPAPAFMPLEPPTPRPRIQKLVLGFSTGALELLNSPACPFDFTALNHLRLTEITGARLDLFLRQIGPTVERLSVDAMDNSLRRIDLGFLPALVHIDCNGFGYGPVLNTMLGGVPTDNCITTIHLSSRSGVLEWDQWATYMRDFDQVVMERLPALREVSLEMHITQNRWEQPDPFEFNHPGLVRAMEAALPRLHEKGLLSVHICAS
ncbi:hypothetical protein B0H19DRAFT_138136 [Mycena capillaripes]|nr:hypothetical protein B0H19DRAFT_138136 [Mycena capillaripes]